MTKKYLYLFGKKIIAEFVLLYDNKIHCINRRPEYEQFWSIGKTYDLADDQESIWTDTIVTVVEDLQNIDLIDYAVFIIECNS